VANPDCECSIAELAEDLLRFMQAMEWLSNERRAAIPLCSQPYRGTLPSIDKLKALAGLHASRSKEASFEPSSSIAKRGDPV